MRPSPAAIPVPQPITAKKRAPSLPVDFDAVTEALRAAVNARLGKTQRLAELHLLDALPRSHIGKVLKRELRDSWQAPAQV